MMILEWIDEQESTADETRKIMEAIEVKWMEARLVDGVLTVVPVASNEPVADVPWFVTPAKEASPAVVEYAVDMSKFEPRPFVVMKE